MKNDLPRLAVLGAVSVLTALVLGACTSSHQEPAPDTADLTIDIQCVDITPASSTLTELSVEVILYNTGAVASVGAAAVALSFDDGVSKVVAGGEKWSTEESSGSLHQVFATRFEPVLPGGAAGSADNLGHPDALPTLVVRFVWDRSLDPDGQLEFVAELLPADGSGSGSDLSRVGLKVESVDGSLAPSSPTGAVIPQC